MSVDLYSQSITSITLERVRMDVCGNSLLSHFSGLEGVKEKHFTDRDVCRPFLLDICINDLFTNTVRTVVVALLSTVILVLGFEAITCSSY